MGKKRFTAEQIISKLREVEVLQSNGQSITEICRHLGIEDQTYYKWRKEYGGMRVDQASQPQIQPQVLLFPIIFLLYQKMKLMKLI